MTRLCSSVSCQGGQVYLMRPSKGSEFVSPINKAKAKVLIVEKKEVKADQAPQPQKDFFPQAQKQRTEMVSSLYKEPVYRIVEKIKNEP